MRLLDSLFTDESNELFDDESVAPSEAENRLHVLLAGEDYDEQPRSSSNDDDGAASPAMTDAEVASRGHQDATGSPGTPGGAGLKALKSA